MLHEPGYSVRANDHGPGGQIAKRQRPHAAIVASFDSATAPQAFRLQKPVQVGRAQRQLAMRFIFFVPVQRTFEDTLTPITDAELVGFQAFSTFSEEIFYVV